MDVQKLLGDKPGILQSSNNSSAVLDPLMPSLSSFWAVEKPGIPFKTEESREFDHICPVNYLGRPQGAIGKNCSSALIYLFHNESCDASLIGVGVSLGVDNQDVSVRPVGDPELVSIQDVVVTFRKKAPHNKTSVWRMPVYSEF